MGNYYDDDPREEARRILEEQGVPQALGGARGQPPRDARAQASGILDEMGVGRALEGVRMPMPQATPRAAPPAMASRQPPTGMASRLADPRGGMDPEREAALLALRKMRKGPPR